MKAPPHLHVVPDAPAPDSPAKAVRKRLQAHDKPAAMLSCPRCSGRSFVETVTGALKRGGRVSGGTKALVCVMCLLNGERVVAT